MEKSLLHTVTVLAGLGQTSHAASLLWATAAGVERWDSLYKYVSYPTRASSNQNSYHKPIRPFQLFTCHFPFHRSHVGRPLGCKTGSGYLGQSVFCNIVLVLGGIQIPVLKYKQELETHAPQALCSEIPGERS